MGKKKTDEPEKATNEVDEEEEEDTPIVKKLKEIDERYCKLEVEYEAEIEAIRKKYDALQAPILEERTKALVDDSTAEDKSIATPACPGFWLQVMNNSDFSAMVEEWDEPVLQYLNDIKRTDLKETAQAGVKLEFCFVENPYFTNDTLWVEIHSDYDPEKYTPWEEMECVEVKSSKIDWKAGKNVTVAMTAKKVKGGGGKKAKQKAKMKEEPRSSFFRFLFRDLKKGDAAPTDLGMDVEEDVDDEEAVDDILEQFDSLGSMFKEHVIPYAIRYYTGEIAADDDDDDDEDEEEESEDGDEEVDDDDEDDGPAQSKAKAKSKKAAKEPAGKGPGKGQEECKQQ